MLGTMIPMLLGGLAVALWFDALAARELAARHARRLCQEAGLQLLDHTVSLQRLGFARRDGRLCLRRRYGFEVSFDGTDRHPANIGMVGRSVGTWTLPVREVANGLPPIGD